MADEAFSSPERLSPEEAQTLSELLSRALSMVRDRLNDDKLSAPLERTLNDARSIAWGLAADDDGSLLYSHAVTFWNASD